MAKKIDSTKSSSSTLLRRIFTKPNITKIYLPSLALLLIILSPVIFEAFKTRHQQLENIVDSPQPPGWIDDIFAPTEDIDQDNESDLQGIMDDFIDGVTDPNRILFRVTPTTHQFYWRLEAYDTFVLNDWEKDLTTSDYTGYSSLPAHADGELFVSSDIVYTGGSFTSTFPAPYNYIYNEEFSNDYEFTDNSYWIPSGTSLETDIYGAISINARFSNTLDNATFNYPVAYTLQDNEYIRDNSNGYSTLNNLISSNPDLNRYLQLPDNYLTTSLETVNIATDLKDTNNDIFTQVFRNLVWLGRNNTYDFDMLLGISTDSPEEGEDHVEWFLNRKMGTSAHFAAALAMICRIQNIPSRFVVGFSYGDLSGSEYLIRSKHIHTWVEAYIPVNGNGYWVAFDPSPLIPGLRDNYGENIIGFESVFYCSNEFFLSTDHMLRQITPPFFVPNPASTAWYQDPSDPSNWYGPYINRTDTFSITAFLGNGVDEDFLYYLITGDPGNLEPIEGELITFIDTKDGITLGSAFTNSSDM
ncbi:MAG: transglutaminase-like domain-containing protein [Candidatus Thorarchaeota archaeon]